MPETATETCWADPLSSRERAKLARVLARHCKRFYAAAGTAPGGPGNRTAMGCVLISAELADLHLDVTERAGPPAWEATDPSWRCPEHDQTLAYKASDGYDERWECPVIGCRFVRWVG